MRRKQLLLAAAKAAALGIWHFDLVYTCSKYTKAACKLIPPFPPLLSHCVCCCQWDKSQVYPKLMDQNQQICHSKWCCWGQIVVRIK